MNWTVDAIYGLTKFLTRKNQSASISPSDLFYAWNTEQNAYQSDLLGKWQARNNGKEGANTGLILDETIMTLMAPFIIPGAVTLINGIASKPDDFLYGLARRLEVGGSEYLVTNINHGQIHYVNTDVIDPPSITDGKYYVVSYDDYYKFLPSNAAGVLHLDYIASCTDIVWGFSYDIDNREIYNPSSSVQPKWSTATIIEITKRALTSFGVSFKDRDFMQFGEKNTVTGDS